jgi:NAD-dependent DNA ligase
MKISTEREFRDNAAGMLRAKDPILVTRRGRLAGIFFPRPETTLPVELKREMFSALSAEVARQISKRGLSEEEILADFQSWRKKRREDSRGR